MRTKKITAYFTVEAGMIFPVVFGVVLLVIYLLLFQYNRCLLEQDVAALALKGCSIQKANKEDVMQELEYYANIMDRSKYLAWDWGAEHLVLEGATVRVEESGSLFFPFGEFVQWEEDNAWEVAVAYENQCVSPTNFLRFCRKVRERSEEEVAME